ncbi:glycosyltransferase [uncultured Campylobacter sp.]|uniref:glycosyltransferase family 2 protein n=1 Tax=uncultured Campylobacter sp. TaxID=218934 RepID=UPI0025CEF76D|nr:glycosyltransferase [uncultured Campylobacter sp.]
MTRNPKVSVLMPIYRTNKEYLQEAIESILSQTFKDFEFLILDDCPDDDRQDIIKLYKDERIKYFKNEKNLGITPSRNKLIDMAKGEYLAVMDHDDISLPTRFEKQVAYLDEHQDVGVVGCWYTTILSHKTMVYPIEHSEIIYGIINGSCYILHPASMIRKSVLIKNNIQYEEEFSPAEDFMLWGKLIEFTKFYNIPDFLFQYRDHIDNTSHLQSDKMNIASKHIVKFLRNKYPQITKEYAYYIPCKYMPLIKIKKKMLV